MRFISFIKSLPLQEDKDVAGFIAWDKRNKKFPQSSDPRQRGMYGADKLDEGLTLGYLKCMALFKHLHGDSLPKDLKDEKAFLDALNTIIAFQDAVRSEAIVAKRPLEYVCFFPVELPIREGDVYVYTGVDAFSRFMFQTGVEKSNNKRNLLKQIKLLIKQPDFVAHRHNGFTLVLHKYAELTDEINSIIAPAGGKLLINDAYLTKIMMPVIESMFGFLSGKG